MDSEVKREFKSAILEISTDVITEVVEEGLDLLISAPEIFEAIPIAGTLVKAVKGGITIRDRLFAARVANFLSRIHDGSITAQEYSEFKNRLESDDEYLRKITKTTISQLEAYNDDIKAIILGEVLKAHIKSKIDFDEYRFFVYAMTNINPIGIKYLMKLHHNYKSGTDPIMGALLVGTGLVAYSTGNYAGNDGSAFLTNEGQKLCKEILINIEDRIEQV